MNPNKLKILLISTLLLIYRNNYAQDTISPVNNNVFVDTLILNNNRKVHKSFLSDKSSKIHFEGEEIDFNKLHKGQQAPDFTLKDILGKNVSLQDFKGKIVYLNFWATWCSPCVAEIPEAKMLEERFKNKNVVFIYLSIDQDESIWRKTIKEKNMTGIQLLCPEGFSSKICQIYKLIGVPTYMLIDKEGNIANTNAKRPSLGGKEDIEKLLN